jgi:hypothetical protein
LFGLRAPPSAEGAICTFDEIMIEKDPRLTAGRRTTTLDLLGNRRRIRAAWDPQHSFERERR